MLRTELLKLKDLISLNAFKSILKEIETKSFQYCFLTNVVEFMSRIVLLLFF